MNDAYFLSDDGQQIDFGYKAGILYSVTPLGGLPVELETSKGYNRDGAPVGGRSVGGVSRTLAGRILRNASYASKRLTTIFVPRTTGRLYVGRYFCNAEVQHCADISASGPWPSWNVGLYCADPYWHSAEEVDVSPIRAIPTFVLPVNYSAHSFGIREVNRNLKITNDGITTQDYQLTLRAMGPVSNPCLTDPATQQFIRFNVDLEDGDRLRIWRDNGILRISLGYDGAEYDAFDTLDETSSLWVLRHGAQIWTKSAASGADALMVNITFNPSYVTIPREGEV